MINALDDPMQVNIAEPAESSQQYLIATATTPSAGAQRARWVASLDGRSNLGS